MSRTRIALVTGAAGSMGSAISRQLALAGHTILMVDRDEQVADGARRLVDDGFQATSAVLDLRDKAAIAEFTDAVLASDDGVDVLVNNAGINLDKPDGSKFFLEEVTDDGWDLMMDVNLRAPFLLCRALVPAMKARGWGRVINIASRGGRTYIPASNVHYSASKAGLIAMTRMIAGETGSFGVTANCVAPGRISSQLADTQSADIIAESLANIPMRSIGTGDDIAAAVTYLASDGAGYVTGTTIDVNGGAFMI